ncbi:MAG: TetR/AcrR family transcriptional regulator [Myxococcota bacterium]|nr:TetR/AcrR family transcriptional regulator [Myxococcota bacterium]
MASGTSVSARRRGPGRPAGGQAGEGQDALLRAARELLAEKGLPGITVREVAERAGVQPALVNYYFGGKQGLLRAVVTGLTRQMMELVARAAATEGSVEERFRAVLRAVVAFWTEEPYAPRLVVEQVLFGEEQTIQDFVEGYARQNLETIRALLEAGEASGEIRHVDPLYALPSTLGGCIFFFLSAPVVLRLFGLERITPELAQELADHTVRNLFHGIAARPGEMS